MQDRQMHTMGVSGTWLFRSPTIRRIRLTMNALHLLSEAENCPSLLPRWHISKREQLEMLRDYREVLSKSKEKSGQHFPIVLKKWRAEIRPLNDCNDQPLTNWCNSSHEFVQPLSCRVAECRQCRLDGSAVSPSSLGSWRVRHVHFRRHHQRYRANFPSVTVS